MQWSSEDETDRLLDFLRSTMRRKKRTQIYVQKRLGWGRTYISQLLRKQKKIRFDQILSILFVIDVEPVQFFAEFFGLRRPTADSRELDSGASISRVLFDIGQYDLKTITLGLVHSLIVEGVLGAQEVVTAIERINISTEGENPHES